MCTPPWLSTSHALKSFPNKSLSSLKIFLLILKSKSVAEKKIFDAFASKFLLPGLPSKLLSTQDYTLVLLNSDNVIGLGISWLVIHIQ